MICNKLWKPDKKQLVVLQAVKALKTGLHSQTVLFDGDVNTKTDTLRAVPVHAFVDFTLLEATEASLPEASLSAIRSRAQVTY